MFNDKIVQIIPAPADMYGVYRGEVSSGKKYEYWRKVVCLALAKDEKCNEQCVFPLCIRHDGVIYEANDTSDFCGIAYATLEEARSKGHLYDESEVHTYE